MEKRLNEIKERKAAILAELADADEQRVAELNTEVDELTAEEAQIRSKMDLAGKLGTPVPKPQARKRDDEAEKRGKELMEKRAVILRLMASSSPNIRQAIGRHSIRFPV